MIWRRLIPISIIAALIVAPFFRWYLIHSGNGALVYLLPGSMDFLMGGAAIAYLEHRGQLHRVTFLSSPALIALCAALCVLFQLLLPEGARQVVIPPIVIVMTGGVIIHGIIDRNSVTLRWLDWPAIKHVGLISYGLYIYHDFMWGLIYLVWPGFFTTIDGFLGARLVKVTVFVLLSLLVAELSWRYIERPLLSLRKAPPASAVARS